MDYYDILLAKKLSGGGGQSIPEIKVNLGKGTSGSTITENVPQRAITDMIPFTNEAHNLIQLYVPSGYMVSIKNCDSATTVVNKGYALESASLVGTSSSGFSTWADHSCAYILDSVNSKYAYADFSNGNGNIRFVFKVGSAGTETVQDIFDGYCVVSGKLYHIVS